MSESLSNAKQVYLSQSNVSENLIGLHTVVLTKIADERRLEYDN